MPTQKDKLERLARIEQLTKSQGPLTQDSITDSLEYEFGTTDKTAIRDIDLLIRLGKLVRKGNNIYTPAQFEGKGVEEDALEDLPDEDELIRHLLSASQRAKMTPAAFAHAKELWQTKHGIPDEKFDEMLKDFERE